MPLLIAAWLALGSVAFSADSASVLLTGKKTASDGAASVATGGARAIVNETSRPNVQVDADTIRIEGGTVRCKGHVKVVTANIAMESPDLVLHLKEAGLRVFLLNPAGIVLKPANAL